MVLQENVAGIKLIQAYGREPHEASRFEMSTRRCATGGAETLNRIIAGTGQELAASLGASSSSSSGPRG